MHHGILGASPPNSRVRNIKLVQRFQKWENVYRHLSRRHIREIYRRMSQFTKEKLEKLRRSTRFNPRPRKRKRSGENGRKGYEVIFPTVDIILSASWRKKIRGFSLHIMRFYGHIYGQILPSWKNLRGCKWPHASLGALKKALISYLYIISIYLVIHNKAWIVSLSEFHENSICTSLYIH